MSIRKIRSWTKRVANRISTRSGPSRRGGRNRGSSTRADQATRSGPSRRGGRNRGSSTRADQGTRSGPSRRGGRNRGGLTRADQGTRSGPSRRGGRNRGSSSSPIEREQTPLNPKEAEAKTPNQSNDKKYVPQGAWLTCANGIKPSQLAVTNGDAGIYGVPVATEGDRIGGINIRPFGACTTCPGKKCSLPVPTRWTEGTDY